MRCKMPRKMPTNPQKMKCVMRLHFLWIVCVLMVVAGPARAQLAQNFINVTAIKVKQLPNATQIRIETDGSAQFGGDFRDFVNLDAGFSPKTTQSLRIRIVRARSKLPAFVPLDAYPVDSAAISLGTEAFSNPYFPGGAGADSDPRVQVELRFAAPVIIRQFRPAPNNAVNFSDFLGPLDVQVEASSDRRAIVVTILLDRADALATQRLDRSPRALRHSNLVVARRKNGRLRIEALHTSLRDVLDGMARVSGAKFLAREEVAGLDISLVLPDASTAQVLDALRNGYGIGFREEEGATIFGKSDEFFEARAFPLQNLSPDAARLLFPDFLLPFLRANRENNSLLVSQTAPISAKIGADLAKLDATRAQFDVQVEAWELASTRDVNQTISLVRSIGADSQTIDFGAGTTSIRVETGQQNRLAARLNLLSQRGLATLVAAPRVTAVSGARGNLFLGQTRYIKILQNQFGGQSAQALALQIGTTLGVTPRGDDENGEVLLDIAPRVSSVDEIEASTGLPTLGIREVNATVRLKAGDALLLAGLDFHSDARTVRKTLGVPSKNIVREMRALLVVVKVKRVGSSGEAG
ncbi:type II and III secretion system protein [Abditibacterium utsteinense]|uniref:Type II and III secretion system protein n=2 Tax=Abditibacterium utsteinense TaxID=1960156 RepID=A0A2S8SQY4_9BACT|nr:type II and III secretion system protein [Abditibacterium utsteinense]